MMSASQKNRGDQAVANEVRTVTNAMERFLVDEQAPLNTYFTSNNLTTDSLADANLLISGTQAQTYFENNYLPTGFANNLAAYTIGLASSPVNGRPSFRALIIRTPDNVLDDGRLSRIASLIGTQGGMISNAGTAGSVTGVLGSWSVPLSTSYGVPLASAALGDIAALTNTVDAQISVNTLSRIGAAGTGVWSEANTMRNDLFMGSAGNANNGGVSDAWAIHNAAGVGYAVTDAVLGAACGGGALVNLYTAANPPVVFNPNQQLATDNYMIVVGGAPAAPQLMQCVLSGGTFQWQPVGGGNNKLQVRTGTVSVTTPCGSNMADANTFVTYKDPTTGLPSPFPNNTLGISTAYYIAENQGGAVLYSA